MRSANYLLFWVAQAVLSLLSAQSPNWIAAGDRALYEGRAAEAAQDYRRALDEYLRAAPASKPDTALLKLRINLATAYLEAGNLHTAEGALQQADEVGAQIADGQPRAELLNAWAAVHVVQGKWTQAERELADARGIMLRVPPSGDLLPAVLHNLAAVQLRTGAYGEALKNESDAMSRWGEILNPDHPHLIKGWSALGVLEYLLGRSEDAHRSFERAIASARKTYGSSHPLVADLLESDALALDRLKLKKDAKLARNEALRIRGGPPTAASGRMTWNVREALAPDSAVYVRSK
jgi:tetratricopeptide (TPR) repeat protein